MVLGLGTGCCDVISIFASRVSCIAQGLRTKNRGQMKHFVLLPQRRKARLWYGDAGGILIYMMFSTIAWSLQCSCFLSSAIRDMLRLYTTRTMGSQIHRHVCGN